ncbi:hypothetical protein IFVP203_C2120023 [Vibrio parahaemolyticus]
MTFSSCTSPPGLIEADSICTYNAHFALTCIHKYSIESVGANFAIDSIYIKGDKKWNKPKKKGFDVDPNSPLASLG